MATIEQKNTFGQDHTHLLRWFSILSVATIVYLLASWINTKRLMKKLNCKQVKYIGDGFFGFKIIFTLLKVKREGMMVDFTKDRYLELDAPNDTFETKILGVNVLMTRDPENLKAILATQFNDFALGTRHAHFRPLLGDGIFTLDGEGWKHSRAMLRPQFTREQVAHVQALEPHIQLFAKHIQKNAGRKFDIQELFFRLTVDSATEFLFGESVESLQDETIGIVNNTLDFDGKRSFPEAFNKSQVYLASRSLSQSLYFLVDNKEFRECNAKVHKFAEYYVQKALNTSPEELGKHSRDGYIFLYELVKSTRDPKVLRDQLLNILLAGRDTTAGLLSFAIFELARNQDVWEKLKAEIYEKFGYGKDVRIEDITFESLKRCEYLKAVINEILRLYPSVPQNFRVATKNTSLPRGGGKDGLSPILVPKGRTTTYSVYATHRNPKIYGKDAENFRPERWFQPNTSRLGWAFLPFNGGPRICLGQQFALTEASYVLTRLIQMFPNLTSYCEEYPPRKSSHLTMCHQNGVYVAMS